MDPFEDVSPILNGGFQLLVHQRVNDGIFTISTGDRRISEPSTVSGDNWMYPDPNVGPPMGNPYRIAPFLRGHL